MGFRLGGAGSSGSLADIRVGITCISLIDLPPFTRCNYHPGSVFPLLTQAGSCGAHPVVWWKLVKSWQGNYLGSPQAKPSTRSCNTQEISATCQKL